MIFSKLLDAIASPPPVPEKAQPGRFYPEISGGGARSASGKTVSVETARKIATAYRCGNVLSDDIACMPFQVYHSFQRDIQRIYPDGTTRNTAYLLERQPNRWMVPFIWKKSLVYWLIHWGNAYIWQPPGPYRELFILPANQTYPVLDQDGNKWYATKFPNQKEEMIPDVEMVHLMINSSDGMSGRSVLTYARETLGRQLSAHETQDKLSNGLNATAQLWVNGELSDEARNKVRKSYLDAATGSENAGGAVVFDNKVAKFDTITMKPSDAQFLEGISLTDTEIANFFGLPLYKLNMGKQSYESNAQQDIDYLKSTLNPYLVQWEQAGGLKWIAEVDQPFVYLKFNRAALLQTDATTREAYLEKAIFSGQITPNEAREVEDRSAHVGGDSFYLPANYGQVQPDGSIKGGAVKPPVASGTNGG